MLVAYCTPDPNDQRAADCHGQAMFILSHAYLMDEDKTWRPVGQYALEVGTEMGSLNCAMMLITWAFADPNYQAPARAKKLVAMASEAGIDWKAMALHCQLLSLERHRPAKVAEAANTARRLLALTEAFSQEDERRYGYDKIRCDLPWRIARDVAVVAGDAELELEAVKLGALEYNDPDACEDLAETQGVEIYSDQWVDLTQKAAMNGHNVSVWRLGKYYLEKHGWYPCTGKPAKDEDSTVGFDWLELAAAGRDPHGAANCYLSIALTCRENGYGDMGRDYLKKAIGVIEAGAGRPHEKKTVTGLIEVLLSDWSRESLTGFHLTDYLEVPRVGALGKKVDGP